jgi:hypothetical protein
MARDIANPHHPKTRKAGQHLRVPVLQEEAIAIKALAATAGLSVAAYLRNVGLGYEMRSILDHERIADLAKVNGDLGRLGGLLKLWLTDDRRLDKFPPKQMAATLILTLKRIDENQVRLREIMKTVVLS